MRRNCFKFSSVFLSVALLVSGCSGTGAVKTETASAKGFGGDVTVTLTAKNGELTAVEIKGDQESPNVGAKAIPQLQKEMSDQKTVKVDAVAGATITSKAVLGAAKDAWDKINGNTAVAEVKMKPGTYTGKAPGYRAAWDVNVSVTVDETKIKSIDVDPDTADTVGIFQSAANLLPKRMVENQSIAVDTICGATVSSNAIKAASRSALEQALDAGGSDTSAIAAFDKEPEKSNDKKVLNTDVLVVGLGAAGTTAALSAAESMYAKDPQSVNVLAIDKAGRYGGASSLCAGVFAVNPKGLENKYNDGKNFTDRDALLKDWINYTDGDAKQDMIELLLDHSGETLDWLVDDNGLELEKPTTGLTAADSNVVLFSYAPAKDGMTVRRQHNISFYDNCMKKYTAMGGKYQLETEAYDLLMNNDGDVTGVKARNTADGTEYEIHAKKVIMGTGGFLANSDMVNKYFSNDHYPLTGSWDMVGMKQNDGKMIEASINDGAGTYNIGMCPAVHIIGAAGFLTNFKYHTLDNQLCLQTMKPTRWTEGDLPHYMGVAPDSLAVDTNGKRFTDESHLNFDAWQSGPNFYSVYSDDQVKAIEQRGLRTAPAYMMTVNLGANGWAPAGTPISNAHEVMDAAVQAGFVFKADTVEDLASQLGMDAAALTKSVDTYNQACTSGTDTEFKKSAKDMDPLSGNGPFYAIKMANYPYSTCAALDVNTNLQVLKTDGSVLNGLYATGLDASGVLYSEKKPYVTYGGVDQGFAFTSGRVAGLSAVKNLDSDN